jgi:hypothetical protein
MLLTTTRRGLIFEPYVNAQFLKKTNPKCAQFTHNNRRFNFHEVLHCTKQSINPLDTTIHKITTFTTNSTHI